MASIAETIDALLVIDPEAEAVEHNKAWTRWSEIKAIIDCLEGLFRQAGVGSDQRIAVLLRNRPGAFAAFLAVLHGDRCLVAVNPVLPDERLVADLASLHVPAAVAESEDLRRPGVLDVLLASGSAVIELTGDPASPARFVDGLVTPAGPGLRAEAGGARIEILTSGTTGKPKRVALKAAQIERAVSDGRAYEAGSGGAPRLSKSVQLITAPLTHISGAFAALSVIASGRRLCLLEKFAVEPWRDAVVRHRLKVNNIPPAALRMVLDANLPKDDLKSLVALRSGTAPLDPQVIDEFLARYDLPVLQAYGATEFAGAVAGWGLEEFRQRYRSKVGSVGRIHKGVEARVVDPQTGEELQAGSEGVLELRAAQLADPTAWTRTTDRAVLDEERYLWIKGRLDNAIIRGGFKVHPDDVVLALESHPDILEAAVVGLPDRRLGQVPVAAVILRRGAIMPQSDVLQSYLRKKLLPYQVPVAFKEMTEFPRTPSLKVSLGELCALFGSTSDDLAVLAS